MYYRVANICHSAAQNTIMFLSFLQNTCSGILTKLFEQDNSNVVIEQIFLEK